MALTDNLQDGMSDMDDATVQRMNDLQQKYDAGELDDAGRDELQQLQTRMGNRGTS